MVSVSILLDDVIDHLSKPYAILSLGAGGDDLAEIVAADEVTEAVVRHRPDGLLISGGGNDILGRGRLARLLLPFKKGRKPEAYIGVEMNAALAAVAEHYRTLFRRLARRAPGLKIFTHGYDWAIPARGRWLGRP